MLMFIHVSQTKQFIMTCTKATAVARYKAFQKRLIGRLHFLVPADSYLHRTLAEPSSPERLKFSLLAKSNYFRGRIEMSINPVLYNDIHNTFRLHSTTSTIRKIVL